MSKILRNKAAGTQFNLKSKKLQSSEFRAFFEQAARSKAKYRKVSKVRIVKPLGKRGKRAKEAKALEEAKAKAEVAPPVAPSRFTKLSAVLETVYSLGCVLMNFNNDVIIDDAEAWYDKTRKETDVIALNINANSKVVTDALIAASNGKGEYAGSTVVVSCNGRFKRPKKAFAIDVTDADFETKRSEYQDVVDVYAFIEELEPSIKKKCGNDVIALYKKNRVLGNVEVNMENVHINNLVDEAEATIAREDAEIKVAEKERLRLYNRKRIYNTETGEYRTYTMFRDQMTGSWVFKQEEQRTALSELLRAIIKERGLSYTATRNLVRHYRLDSLFQLNFQGNFLQADDFKYIYLTPDGKIYAHTTNQEVEPDQELEYNPHIYMTYRCLTDYTFIDVLPEGTLKFVNVAHGASGVRKNSSIYMLDDGKVEKILDRASRGIYGCFKGQMLNNAEIVKANTRIMASAAPSQILYNVDAFALYVGKFGVGDKDSLIKKFKGLNGTLDGTAFTLFDAMQARLGSSKIFATRITKRLMQMMIRFFDANPIVLEIGEEQTEEQKAIIKAAFEKKDKTVKINGELVDLTGRVIICKKKGSKVITPEYFSDLNGFKAAFDVSKGFEVPVLDMPKRNHAYSSTQFLSKVIAAGGLKAVDLITNRMKAHFDSLLENFHKDSEIRIEDVKDPYLKGIIGKACPEYMKLDFSLTRQNVDLMLNSMSKSLNRMRFPIKDSANGRAVPDIGALFGMPILEDNEVYTVDIKSGTEVIVIKYPTIGEREFWKATCLSYEKACGRINKFEIPVSLKGFGNDFRSELKNYFRTFEPGCTMMPADKAIMHGLAGMDFDYDMVILIHDKEFVAIFKDTKPGVIHIMNPDNEDEAKQEFNYRKMSDPQLKLIAKTAANVGGVTNNYNIPMQFDLLCRYAAQKTELTKVKRLDAMLALDTEKVKKITAQIARREAAEQDFINTFCMLVDYSIMSAGDAVSILNKRNKTIMEPYDFTGKSVNIKNIQEGLRRISDRSEGPAYEPIGSDYNNPLYIYLPVSKEQKEHAEEQLKSCRIATLEDVRMICADINRIARSDQETTIDSAKTSIVANIALNFSKFFNVFSKIEYDYEVDRKTNGIIRYVKRPNGDRGDLGKKYYIYDVFSIIRDDVEKYIIPKVQQLVNDSLETSRVFISKMKSYEDIPVVSACMDLASLYGTMAHNSAEKVITLEKEVTHNIHMAIHNMMIMFIKDTIINKSANSLGRFATWLSCYGRSNGSIVQKDAKTSFNTACFPIETLYYGYKITNKLARVCEPITCINSEIIEDGFVNFTNGNVYNEDGRLVIVAKEFLNGKFKISKVNGKYMACDGISSYLNRDDYSKEYIAFSVKGVHEDLEGDITFDAYKRGSYSCKDSSKIVIDGKIYESPMYAAMTEVKRMGKELSVAYTTPISKDLTVVVAKIGGVVTEQKEEMLDDNLTTSYMYDDQYGYTDEEVAAIADFNANDYGYEYADIASPNFDEGESVEFEDLD